LRAEKRILDDEGEEYKYFYHIHYNGTSKLHDTWLEENYLYKYNVDLLTGVDSLAAEEARARAWMAEDERKAKLRLIEIPEQLRLRISPKLKQTILDDYDMVMNRGRILRVPRPGGSTVTEILDAWKKKMNDMDDVVGDEQIESIEIVAESLVKYFNTSLRQFLLYHIEVPLCDRMLGSEGGKLAADLYGAEHLVRLLVKLPELVCVALMALPESAKYIVAVEDLLQDLIGYLADSRNTSIFAAADEYVPAYTLNE
jgi:mortality factor 4-like protein 1